MKTREAWSSEFGGCRRLSLALLFLMTASAGPLAADTLYVAMDSPSDGPGDTWSNAWHTIQDAVDHAVPGDLILVTNGIYSSGDRIIPELDPARVADTPSRVVATNGVVLQSVNGPDVTIIDGLHEARCLYLDNGTTVEGFTLRNGNAFDLDINNRGVRIDDGWGGGALIWDGTLSNCHIRTCSAIFAGGGVVGGTVWNSVIADCSLHARGGGAYESKLRNSAVYGNRSTGTFRSGAGGLYGGEAVNCTIVGNVASMGAGGVMLCRVTNSIVYHNRLGEQPDTHIQESTFVNSFTTQIEGGNATNLINVATNHPLMASFSHLSPDSPCIGFGTSQASIGMDIDGETWASPPSAGCDEFSPGATGPLTVDIQPRTGVIRKGTPALFRGIVTGPAVSAVWLVDDVPVQTNALHQILYQSDELGSHTLALRAYNADHPEGVAYTQDILVVEGSFYADAANTGGAQFPYTNWATAAVSIQDAVDVAVLNGVTAAQVFVADGVYTRGERSSQSVVVLGAGMTLTSMNGPDVTVIQGEGTLGGTGAVRCVSMGGGALLAGFTLTNGTTRTDLTPPDYWYRQYPTSSSLGGGVVGGTVSNCLLVGCSALQGGGAYGASLIDSVLIGNTAGAWGGGGAQQCSLRSCIVAGNSAGGSGGGVAYGSLAVGCLIMNNSTGGSGGGAWAQPLQNCVLRGNTGNGAGAYLGTIWGPGGGPGNLQGPFAGVNCTFVENHGSGVSGGVLVNCILYHNEGANYGGDNLTITYSCASPLPEGTGNTAAEPLFLDRASQDYRLLPASPCINSGTNGAWMTDALDLGGHPRLVNGLVDMGAYEWGGLWPEAENAGDGWKYSQWFGFFHDGYWPWIYHLQHTWMYPVGSDPYSLWLYTLDMGWLYTAESLHPWFYGYELNTWLYYLPYSADPRWFYIWRRQEWWSDQMPWPQ